MPDWVLKHQKLNKAEQKVTDKKLIKEFMKSPIHDRSPVWASDVTLFQSSTSEIETSTRPEVIERGRELAADDSYPPFAICQQVASSWLDSLPAEELEASLSR